MNFEQSKTIATKPDIVSLEAIDDNSVVVTWLEAAGADRYIVKRVREGETEYQKISVVQKGITSYTDTSITSQGVYRYIITAQKSEGLPKTIFKNGATKTVVVTDLKAPVLTDVVSKKGRIVLSWQKTDEVDGYAILRRHSFMKDGVIIAETEGNVLSYTDNDFVKGPTFYYSVQGIVKDGESLIYSHPGNELVAVCLDSTEICEVKRLHGKKVRITVRLTSGAEGYVLLRCADEKGKYEEVARTESFSDFVLSDKAGKGAKSAYYKACAYKTVEGKVYFGPETKALLVKYKI